MGMVTPLGCGVEPTWKRLIAGESGAQVVDRFDISDIAAKVACTIPRGDGSNGTYNADQWMESKEQRKVDDFIVYAMAAARQALDDANWHPTEKDDQVATGVMIGSGIGGIEGIAETAIVLKERGPRRVSPFFIPGRIINLASGYVSIEHGLKGPNHAVVTACSTGAHAIGDASRLIALGDADVMVAGGAESPVNRISLAGFAALRALSTAFNDQPARASRPYDKDRDGFVIAGGAGVLVLEELEHAKARGARIYAEVVGYGATSDGYDMVAPSGEGAVRCMQMALGTCKAPIDYINPHATATPVGDAKEIEALRTVFGSKCPPISATKSLSGHSLGAAGVQEAIYSLLMMNNGFVCESANIDNLDPEFADMPIVRERRDNVKIGAVLSNSFGFGGTNASVVFKRLDA